MYTCQFHGITAQFATLQQASHFAEFYRRQTGVFLGIEETTPKPRKASPRADLPERADLDRAYAERTIRTKDEYFNACKRIALRDDLRFLIRVAGERMPAEILQDARALLSELEVRAGKPADAKAINQLRDRYRMAVYSWSRPAYAEIGAVA